MGGRLRQVWAAGVVGLVGAIWLSTPASVVRAMAPDSPNPIWAGVFTNAQAERGHAAYERNCSRCHRIDLSGDEGITLNGELYQTLGPALKGDTFFKHWGHGSLSRLFRKIRDAMPPDFQSIVDDSTKIDVVAYLLHENGFPAGPEELTRDAGRLEEVQIVPQGADLGALPNFALVQIVGCLEPGPENRWMLTDATEPILSRDGPFSAPDLRAAKGRPPGAGRYLLLNTSSFDPLGHRGQRMVAKGLLYSEPHENRLTVGSLQMVDATCQK